ncbi:MAG TPA: bifunctional homocysteine S-methyltransferase/methylenetetrahydrofolate reductase [Ktedonobacterales bacterium]|nr:bifunctional homocysteine S-methyltransferase/methylenetetrahydrofolate reductase [Ktedonobacterales bacterium]
MSEPALERLRQGPVLCDGAMGTMLYARAGASLMHGRCFDELTLTAPELVQQVHRQYILAGAEIVETNTFGANAAKLNAYGLADQARVINRRAAKLAYEARDIAGQSVFVAGAVGPSGQPVAPTARDDEPRLAALRAIFREQIEGLVEGGADLIILETFSSLTELRQAALAAREVGSLPIVAQMTFAEDGQSLSGETPAQAARALALLGVDVIGANCSVGPAGILDAVVEMAAALRKMGIDPERDVLLAAQPNAGLPTRVENRFLYVSTPAYFADYAQRFASAGVRLVGGCCGTTPEHIAAMRGAIGAYLPEQASAWAMPAVIAPAAPAETFPPEELTERTHLQEDLEAGRFVVSVELDPPKGLNPRKIMDGAARLREAGVRYINIADSPMARVRMSCLALARLLRDYLDLETIIHFTTRDRNLMAIQSDLLGAHALGSHNILALTGDPLRAGNYPNLTGVWDVDSVGLVRILKGMNEGHDAAGGSLGLPARFFIGAALNLNMEDRLIDVDQERARRKLALPGDVAHELLSEHGQMTETELELHRLRDKLDAGAQFIMTQPIYELAPLERFAERFGPVGAPIILGMIPLHSAKHAEYLHNEVPGMSIPEEVRARMREAGEQGREVGIALAREIITQARSRGLIQGCYLMPSYGRYDLVADLSRELLEG